MHRLLGRATKLRAAVGFLLCFLLIESCQADWSQLIEDLKTLKEQTEKCTANLYNLGEEPDSTAYEMPEYTIDHKMGQIEKKHYVESYEDILFNDYQAWVKECAGNCTFEPPNYDKATITTELEVRAHYLEQCAVSVNSWNSLGLSSEDAREFESMVQKGNNAKGGTAKDYQDWTKDCADNWRENYLTEDEMFQVLEPMQTFGVSLMRHESVVLGDQTVEIEQKNLEFKEIPDTDSSALTLPTNLIEKLAHVLEENDFFLMASLKHLRVMYISEMPSSEFAFPLDVTNSVVSVDKKGCIHAVLRRSFSAGDVASNVHFGVHLTIEDEEVDIKYITSMDSTPMDMLKGPPDSL
eukprot:GHVS01002669.1.p1 GENE.GHVS01002669.1~~GHVS01002669.1.p1  ORF type:complete len:352 (-),score=31.94 GHVS01002669.1:311-1366(-)